MRQLSALLLALGCVGFSLAMQDSPKERLEKSPRHLEFVKVKVGDREVECFVAFPEKSQKTTAVLVIHEIFGLSDWIRGVADQFAEAGYLAIAPDLLSGLGPKGGGTADLGGGDGARRVIGQLKPEQITADLNAAADYVTKLPAANGKLVVAGFCWGGGQAFRYATNRKDLKAAFVFYGSFPHTLEDLQRINCPVHGFYGSNDARVNATVPKSVELMKQAGKTFEPVTYDGAGHGFLRAGEPSTGSPANRAAREAAWSRMKKLLADL